MSEAERTGVSNEEHWEITDGGVGPSPNDEIACLTAEVLRLRNIESVAHHMRLEGQAVVSCCKKEEA